MRLCGRSACFVILGKGVYSILGNSERRFGFGNLSWYDRYYGKTQKRDREQFENWNAHFDILFFNPLPLPASNGG